MQLSTLLRRAIHVLFIPLFLPFINFAQTAATVSGTITTTSGAPVAGVSVSIKGTSSGSSSNSSGHYTINGVQSGSVLVFSYVGYKTMEIPVNGRSTIDVQLTQDTRSLGEVVVVAYGTQIRRDITGAVQSVNTEDLGDLPVTQLTQKLQGKLSGVQIVQGTGRPGYGMGVRIRGQASISAQAQPLYVVDGFPISGDISTINPDEIESITVLKDASSASLYGSRAAFGVVLVQTKRAKSGQNVLDLNAWYGIQQVPQKGRPDMMNAREFAQFQKEIAEINNRPVPTEYQNPEQYGEGTNWYDVLLRDAPMQNYNLSVRSNKDKFSSAVVAGFMTQEGVLINSGFKRFSLRLNTEYRFSEKIKLGFNLAPTYSLLTGANLNDGALFQGVGAGGSINAALATSPIAVHKNPDGSLPLTANGPLFTNPNWYRTLQEIKRDDRRLRLLSNAFLEYEVLEGLALKTAINVELGQTQINYFSPSTAGAIAAAPPQKPRGEVSNNNFYSWLSENTATYKRSIGDHEFDLLAGFTVQQFRNQGADMAKTDYPDDRIATLNAATTFVSGGTGIDEWSLVSYLARINYNFKGRYLLTAAFRRDGSSRFGSNNKWGNFPSVSVGWILTDEKWAPATNWLSLVKLRASYGLTGNNNIGNYSYYASLGAANYVFNGRLANGRAVTSIGNLELGWERTKQLDLGIDIGLFNDRVSISYDYYRKRTDGLLFSVGVPSESGFTSVLTNLGEFKFWGHEITLSSQNINNKNFKWRTDFNIAFNDNRVMRLGLTNTPIYGVGNTTITRVGDRIGQFWGFDFQGIYQNQADLDRSPKYPSSAVGTVKMGDINGDGKITNSNDDKTVIGDPWPHYIYGISNTFVYKNFDLSIIASGSAGNDIMNRGLEILQNLDGPFNVTRDVTHRWKSEQDPGNGQHPSSKAGTTDLARFSNSRWVSSGSFLTIKNIALGYNMPIKKNKFIRTVRLFASIQQAFVFTSYDGANPEVNLQGGDALNQGVDYSAYPVPRTWNIGFNASF
jgi:TonB-dependent starch-binding outer membrane protein SusC